VLQLVKAFISQSDDTFGGLGTFLLPNPLDVKNVVRKYLALENCKILKSGKLHSDKLVIGNMKYNVG
jgi:hypothetical protein